MKYPIALFAAALCLFLSSCHRPVAYFQPMPRPVVERLALDQAKTVTDNKPSEATFSESLPATTQPEGEVNQVSLKHSPEQTTNHQVERRMRRMQSLLSAPAQATDKQPDPKPKKKLRLGNQIRQSLGMKLRPELNWWQRISWKLKASVIVLLVAVVFAITHITVLAIIFGLLGAFLLITGLKRSFKVRRPWF